ncbi:UNVERIFIED_CONTAM: hypothetical protein PYX00_002500 [Menopon gallinae]|uniref:PH domain-containing protein n=1 Tax=Menopon gallinae TaxID=328185 RepID=A0AAW2IGZ6_9NEOP
MASRWKLGMGFVKLENVQCGEESSESENESDSVKPFVRKLSTNRNIKSSAAIKEGYLLKQTSFQRWRRRYFRLKGRTLYYAKDAKVRFM